MVHIFSTIKIQIVPRVKKKKDTCRAYGKVNEVIANIGNDIDKEESFESFEQKSICSLAKKIDIQVPYGLMRCRVSLAETL